MFPPLSHRSYEFLTKALTRLGVDFIPASAGIFVFADFSSTFRISSFEDERIVHQKFVTCSRVLFTPGEICHTQIPGWFRICFAWVQFEVLQIVVENLEKLIIEFKFDVSCVTGLTIDVDSSTI